MPGDRVIVSYPVSDLRAVVAEEMKRTGYERVGDFFQRQGVVTGIDVGLGIFFESPELFQYRIEDDKGTFSADGLRVSRQE